MASVDGLHDGEILADLLNAIVAQWSCSRSFLQPECVAVSARGLILLRTTLYVLPQARRKTSGASDIAELQKLQLTPAWKDSN